MSNLVSISHSDCILVSSVDMLKQILDVDGAVVAVDTETTGLDTAACGLVGISFCFEGESEAYYIPLSHVGFKGNLVLSEVLPVFQSFIYRCKLLVFHNLNFDYKILKRFGFLFTGSSFTDWYASVFDTMIAAYLIDNISRHYSLSYLVKKHFGYDMIPFETLAGLYGGAFNHVPISEAVVYASEDAFFTMKLYEVLLPDIQEFRDLAFSIEFPLIIVLADMEISGLKLDMKQLEKTISFFESKCSVLESEIYKAVGKEFNIRSTTQLGDIFVGFGVPVKHTRKRAVKVDKDSLKRYSLSCPFAKLVIDFRRFSSSLSSCLYPLRDKAVAFKIYSNYNQCVPVTGRLSCSNPNLQAVPKERDFEGMIRSCFVSLDKDSLILRADYSQIELRLLAHFSKDAVLLEAFERGEDLHKRTASLVFGVPVGDVSEAQRSKAKTLNFGVLYGEGAYSVSLELGISYSEAKFLIEHFLDSYKGVIPYRVSSANFALKYGYALTLLNRRCRIYGLEKINVFQIGRMDRRACNYPIQGSCADLIKKAMVNIVRELAKRGLKARLLLQVHDELVFSVPKSEVGVVKSLVKDIMESVVSLQVPLVVDIGIGKNWFKSSGGGDKE